MVEVMHMELGHEPHDQDTDLISRAPDVTPQSPPPPVSDSVLIEQGEVFLLDDDPMMDV